MKLKDIRWLKIISFSGGFLLLLIPLIQSLSIDLEVHQAYQAALAQQQFQRTILNDNILQARYQILASYDPLVATLQLLEANQTALNVIPAFIEAEGQKKIQDILNQQRILLEKEEELIERFKLENALLKNSLRYLPELKAELVTKLSFQESDRALIDILDRLLQNVLLYNLTSEREVAKAIEADLKNLQELQEQYDFGELELQVELTASHTQIILDTQPEVNHLTQLIIQLSNTILVDRLEVTYRNYHEKAVQKINLSRFWIYLLSLLILFIIAYEIIVRLNNKNKKIARINADLNKALKTLKTTQAQLIQTEKMSGLGQMVAGVAHEINNPVSFIYSNIEPTREYLQNLVQLIEVYQQEYPNPTAKIQEMIEDIDLDFLLEDLPKVLNSMKLGAKRIREIVLSLRTFSRLDESEQKTIDIHEGIDSTLTILRHRLADRSGFFTIEIIKNYGNLPWVGCYPRQINQAFLNLLNNAIDSLHQNYRQPAQTPNPTAQNVMGKITIATQVEKNPDLGKEDWISICITDNGAGIPKEIQSHIFEPFFTTKPIGRGTGLGLSISYQIVVENHGGTLEYASEPGQGTTFWLKIPVLLQPNDSSTHKQANGS